MKLGFLRVGDGYQLTMKSLRCCFPDNKRHRLFGKQNDPACYFGLLSLEFNGCIRRATQAKAEMYPE